MEDLPPLTILTGLTLKHGGEIFNFFQNVWDPTVDVMNAKRRVESLAPELPLFASMEAMSRFFVKG